MLEEYGATIARWFDVFDYPCVNRAVYGAYYPGYGDSWCALHGATGMTFEMASARGRVGRWGDDSLANYFDGIRQGRARCSCGWSRRA